MSDQSASSGDDLARRRARTNRMAWLLGAVVIAIYVLGLLIKR